MTRYERSLELLTRAGLRPLAWIGLPLLLYVWTLPGPFMLDDLHLIMKAESYHRGERDHLGLYQFAPNQEVLRGLMDRGSFPWWTPEDLRAAFFRPLAEWSFYADTLIFGRKVIGHRIESLAWFVLVLVLVHRLYLKAGGRPAHAGVATLLFGISQPLTSPVAFMCNRSDLFVMVGLSISAYAYWSAGSRSVFKTVLMALAGFVFALFCKEMALPFVGVIVLHELLARWRGWNIEGQKARGWVAVCLIAAAVAYLAYYLSTQPAGGQIAKNKMMLLIIALNSPRNLGLYLSVWTMGFPITLLNWSSGLGPSIALALVGLGFGWILRKPLRGQMSDLRESPFFALWAVMFLCLALLTIAEPRALSVATVGWAYLLAGFILPREGETNPTPMWLRQWLLTTNGIVSILCIVVFGLMATGVEFRARKFVEGYVKTQEVNHTPIRDGDTLIIGQSQEGLEVMMASERLEYLTGLRNVSINYLTVVETNAKFSRQDDHTLLVEAKSPNLLNSGYHQALRGPYRKSFVGEKFRGRDFTVEVAAIEGDVVTQLKVRFDEPLTSPKYHFHPESLAAIARGRPTSR